MYVLKELLEKTVSLKGSDLHISVGIKPFARVSGELLEIGEEVLKEREVDSFVREILKDDYDKYCEIGEVDTAYSLENIGRFRVNIYRCMDKESISFRVINLEIPTIEELNLPSNIYELVKKKRGLILVTGPTGSGKSTTLAAMINEINKNRKAHIITLEDPIEYVYKNKESIINQREIGRDSKSYKSALRAALREDPDIILIGEMRDLDTISIAITAAETGHLVFSTLHTIGSSKTIDRIVDVFPVSQQEQIKIQLSSVLQGIISQQLIKRIDKEGRIAAVETMIVTKAISNQIREGKTYQIESSIQTGGKYGMKTMDIALGELVRDGIISEEDGLEYSVDKEMIKRILNF